MRHSTLLLITSVWAAGAACGDDSQGPTELNPADTAQTRGYLISSGESMQSGSALTWVPGTELIAFAQWAEAGCVLKALDVESGTSSVVDDDCVSTYSFTDRYLRTLVAASDGRLYYVVGVGDIMDPAWVLRSVVPGGGGAHTVRSVFGGPALAVSTDGQLLAYSVRDDSLIVRELPTGTERQYAEYARDEGSGGPIVFSPDGTELLYGKRAPLEWTHRRLSLDAGTSEPVSLPQLARALLFHWDAAGIEAFVEMSQEYPPEYRVLNLTTGESIQVGSLPQGEGVPYEQFVGSWHAWSSDGTRVAYWTLRCLDWTGLFDCGIARRSLFVADTRSGSRTLVAYTDAAGPTVFSPDGSRLVYHVADGDSSGDFYLVDVP